MEYSRSSTSNSIETYTLKYLFDLLRRSIWWLLLITVLSAGIAFAVSNFQEKIYQARTQVMVTRSSSSGPVSDVTQIMNVQQLTQTYVELLSQGWVREDVHSIIGGDVRSDQITITAATNTMVINIIAEDPDPKRAELIADTLVQVLIDKNEEIQSSRYNDAEASLDLQINQVQSQIETVQTQLNVARSGALDEKITESQDKLQATQDNISAAQDEIDKLNTLTQARAQVLLISNQNTLNQQQTVLDNQLANYQEMKNTLETDPQVLSDPAYKAGIEASMAELGVAINQTRSQIEKLQREITWLTPLVEPGAIEKALLEQQEYLLTQETLLVSYQNIYTNLLVSDQAEIDTDEIEKLTKDLDLYQQIYLNLMNNRETVRLEKMQNMPNVVAVNKAEASPSPVRPRIWLNTIISGAAGLIFAIVAVLVIDALDTTIKTRDDVERVLNIPIIGYIFQLAQEEKTKDGPYVVHVPRSPAAEAFRSLRTNLEFIGVDQPLKSVLISSPGAGEGKTTVATNLAAVIAQSGKRVVLVDADLRRPRIHKELGLVNRVGLSDVFRDRVTLKDIYQTWDDLSLSIITSGGIPPNPAELLGSGKMGVILDELKAEFDFVIIDSTPIVVTDSQLIAARVDGVLLVLWPGRTDIEAARLAAEQYRRVGARMLGAVLNNIQPGQGYGYGGYTNYHYDAYNREGLQPKGFLRFPWRQDKITRKK
ncbi:MAG: polysaccharide biosynthesis tyrosine autokinase [Anaerolineales bacterium]|nr:polysaccharide biosynthesis tyrosine autokinase [Anaerolineales bacterium]